jgi:uncharacterized protein (TIGR02145 family)
MKTKLFLSVLFSLNFYLLFSQVPQGFNYQALAGDASGNPIRNTDLQVKIGILSDTITPIIVWEELHSNVRTNVHGIFSLVIGTGARQPASSAVKFSDINWTASQLFIRTQIYYLGVWKNLGVAKLWSVPYSMIAGDLSGAVKKLAVTGETASMDEALFEVKNKNGQTVFAVYNEGVRIYVDDGAKGAKGGFAIGGFDQTKGINQDYFTVNRDSVRVYLDTNPGKSAKGGFAIGGFDKTKGSNQNYFVVNPDSIRAYIYDDPLIKRPKGGFAIGGFNNAKGMSNDYFVVSPDSIRAYIAPDLGKGAKGGFAIGGFNNAKSTPEEYLRVTRDSIRAYINNNPVKAAKGGFAIGGFSDAKGFGNEYLSVTTDSVKVSKSLLIPRLTMEERDNLPFTPGEALIIFNTTEGCMQIFKNSVWSNIWCFNCAPSFIIQPVDQTICSGGNAIFFVSATGTNLSYQWQMSADGGNTWNNITNGGSNPSYSGAKGYTLNISFIPVQCHSNKFRCVVAGSCLPNVNSDVVTLNVGSTPPVISSQPADQELTQECSANFSVISPGYGVSYRWQQSTDGGSSWNNITNGGTNPTFSGSTSSILSLSNVPGSFNNYKYRCIVSNLCGSDATSNAAALALNTSQVIATQPANKLIYAGYNTYFSIEVAGNGFYYQWQVSTNGGDTYSNLIDGGSNPTYTGANTSNLSLLNVPITYNNNKYRCLLSHSCHSNLLSNAATLSVPTANPVTDIDGNIYNTVGIGFQLWMTTNLKTTKYNDGTTIPIVTDNTAWINLSTPGYCWYNNNEATYKNIYGALYNWYTVNTGKLCPIGWHVPSDWEWSVLGYALGGESVAGGKLKETGTTHWLSPNTGATNETGFTALPGSSRTYNGFFRDLGYDGWWWSSIQSTLDNQYAKFLSILNSSSKVWPNEEQKILGFSVRCIKDN